MHFFSRQGEGITAPVADKVIDDLIGLFTAAGVHPVQTAQYKRHFVAHGRGKDTGIISTLK